MKYEEQLKAEIHAYKGTVRGKQAEDLLNIVRYNKANGGRVYPNGYDRLTGEEINKPKW